MAEQAVWRIQECIAQEEGPGVEDHVLKLPELREPEVQVALVRAAGTFLPLAVIQEVVPADNWASRAFNETVGTKLILQLLKKEGSDPKELVAGLRTRDFSEPQMAGIRRMLGSVAGQLVSPAPAMESTTIFKQAFDRGIAVVRNIVLNNAAEEMQVEDVMKYFQPGRVEEFSSEVVQMALLRVARRLGHPLQVEQLVLHELQQNRPQSPPFLGFRVLVEVAQANHYGISSVESLQLAGDLAPGAACREAAWVASLADQRLQSGAEERVALGCPSASVTAEVLVDCLTGRGEMMQRALQMVERLPQLDTVPGQAALLGLASSLVPPQKMYQAMATEMLAQHRVLPIIGSLALCAVVEQRTLGRDEVEVLAGTVATKCRAQEPQDQAVWQGVAAFLQLPLHAGDRVAEWQQVEMDFANALVNTVHIINEERQEESIHSLSSTTALPQVMEELGSQLGLISISERLVGAAQVEELVAIELAGRCPTERLGVATLASALEYRGLGEGSAEALLQPGDLGGAGARHRLATLLCLAHAQALQVRVCCKSESVCDHTVKGEQEMAAVSPAPAASAAVAAASLHPAARILPHTGVAGTAEVGGRMAGEGAGKERAAGSLVSSERQEATVGERAESLGASRREERADGRLEGELDAVRVEELVVAGAIGGRQQEAKLKQRATVGKTEAQQVVTVDRPGVEGRTGDGGARLEKGRAGLVPMAHEAMAVRTTEAEVVPGRTGGGLPCDRRVKPTQEARHGAETTAMETVLVEAHKRTKGTKAMVTSIPWRQEPPLQPTEIVASSTELETATRVAKMVASCHRAGMTVTEATVLLATQELAALETPGVQAALLTLAGRLGAAAQEQRAAVVEAACSTREALRTIGLTALLGALESSETTGTDVATCFSLDGLGTRKETATAANVLKEAYSVGSEETLEEVEEKPGEISQHMLAIRSMAGELSEGKEVGEVVVGAALCGVDRTEALETQMAVVGALERLGLGEVTEQVVVEQLVEGRAGLLTSVGTRALASVLAQQAVTIEQVLACVQPGDLRPAAVRRRVAKILSFAQTVNVAQVVMVQAGCLLHRSFSG
jgi:hypothetical protein